MPAAITISVVALILAGYGVAMLRRRARLRDLASELGGDTTSFVGLVTDPERLRRTVDVLSRVAGGGRGR